MARCTERARLVTLAKQRRKPLLSYCDKALFSTYHLCVAGGAATRGHVYHSPAYRDTALIRRRVAAAIAPAVITSLP